MQIDQIKSAISSRDGLAKGNRYAVFIAHPASSFNEAQLRSGNLERAVVNRFTNRGSLHLRQFVAEPRDLFILCKAVQLPGRQIQTLDHLTSMKQIKKPNAYLIEDVEMTFRVTNDYYAWNFFNAWLDMIITRDIEGQAHKIKFKQEYVTDIIIQHVGRNNIDPAKSIRLINAYPITLGQIDLGDDNADVVECPITFAYDDWIEEEGYSTLIDFVQPSQRTLNYLSFFSSVSPPARRFFNQIEQGQTDIRNIRRFFNFNF